MQSIFDETPDPGAGLGAVVKGCFAGAIVVFAIAVWSINIEKVVTGQVKGGMAMTVVRLILCDAIPLATLFAVIHAVGQNHSAERMIRSIIATIGWALGGFFRTHTRDDHEHADPL